MEIKNMLSRKEFADVRRSVIGELEKYQLIKQTSYFGKASLPEALLEPTDPELIQLIEFCKYIEQATRLLPSKERELIEGRFLNIDNAHITDREFYFRHMNPPVSPTTFTKIRDSAISKLAMILNLDCIKWQVVLKGGE